MGMDRQFRLLRCLSFLKIKFDNRCLVCYITVQKREFRLL